MPLEVSKFIWGSSAKRFRRSCEQSWLPDTSHDQPWDRTHRRPYRLSNRESDRGAQLPQQHESRGTGGHIFQRHCGLNTNERWVEQSAIPYPCDKLENNLLRARRQNSLNNRGQYGTESVTYREDVSSSLIMRPNPSAMTAYRTKMSYEYEIQIVVHAHPRYPDDLPIVAQGDYHKTDESRRDR